MSATLGQILFLIGAWMCVLTPTFCDYHLTIDAGGSSTKLQVLDSEGYPLLLKKNGEEPTHEILGGPLNVTNMEEEEIVNTFHHLLDHLMILDGKAHYPLTKIAPFSTVTFGGAGMGTRNIKNTMEHIFSSFGFLPQKLDLQSDAALALKLVKGSGGILISGTGSVCFAKEGDKFFRSGGLGWLLGDEGSAYKIGLAAIKKSIDQEYGCGDKTAIYEDIKQTFACEHLHGIIYKLQSGEISRAQIAALSPLVFEWAHKQDGVCVDILDKAANDLGTLAAKALKNLDHLHPIIYLIGGTFKDRHAHFFIKKIANSPAIMQLKQTPLFVNIARANYASALVYEHLLSAKDPDQLLFSLPFQEGCFRRFSKIWNLEAITTEQSHPKTQNLSQVFHQNNIKGIELLHEVDSEIIRGMHTFERLYHQKLSQQFLTCIKNGGRIFLIGSGSSGRVAVNLATKWNQSNANYSKSVIGIIAGGPRALIKARPGYEDSEAAGASSLEPFAVNQKDLVVLISASASAKFNIGAGKLALEKGAHVFYFYNSETTPSYAQKFLSQPEVSSLLVDVGAQAIRGSTRLQAASAAILCLGSCLNQVGLELQGGLEDQISPFDNYQNSHHLLSQHFANIAKIIELEVDAFQSPCANFYRTTDENPQGYVTFICNQKGLLDTTFDCVETSPTFSLNSVCSKQETEKKAAEYRAYMISDPNVSNQSAWDMALGKGASQTDIKDFLINIPAQGHGSYHLRPKGVGNVSIGVLSETVTPEELEKLAHGLHASVAKGGKTALIAILSSKAPESLKELAARCEASVIVDQIGDDFLGISKTLILKEILNLISNSAMIKMGKVHGNIMIDLSPSNHKLIERSIRIIKEIYKASHLEQLPAGDELIFHLVKRASAYKKLVESQHKICIPPPIPIVLKMIEEKCSITQAIEKIRLEKRKEDQIIFQNVP